MQIWNRVRDLDASDPWADDRPALLPAHRRQERFPAKVIEVPSIWPHGKQDHPPLPILSFHEVGMARSPNGIVQTQMPMCQKWVARIRFIWPTHRFTPSNGHGMLMSGTAFSNHQVISSIYFVNVWRRCPGRSFESTIPKDRPLTDETHGLQVQFLQPDL